MYQLGNFGFAMTHSFITGRTLGFLHGWNVLSDRTMVTDESILTHSERIHDSLRSSASLWRHPLLLPTLILQEHLFRSKELTWRTLSPRLRGIEKELGVTRSGRLVHLKTPVSEEIKRLVRDDVRRLQMTTEVSSTLTDTINLVNVLTWDQRLGQFIQRVDKELRIYYPKVNINQGVVKELESSVDHFLCEAIGATDYIGAMRSRLEIQLNVVRYDILVDHSSHRGD
jgi:hypothetical protein